jgi:hypothetical protein
MQETRRGVVISNCQVQPLKHILSLFCKDIRFDGFGVHLLPPQEREQTIERFVESAKRDYDVVLAAPLSDEFGPIGIKRLRNTFSGSLVGTVPNFYFSGLHPDLTYIGQLGTRVIGPLEDYHSKIAIYGYLQGLSVDECLRLYRDGIYRDLGYYDEYEKSLAELRRRDAALDIPFTDEISGLLKTDLCFFSVNHPTSFLLGEFCIKLTAWLEHQGVASPMEWPYSVSSLPNQLAQNVFYPVYPEIAAACDLSFPGSYTFKPTTVGDNPVTCFGLREFVEGEYESFGKFEREQFVQAPQVRAALELASGRLETRVGEKPSRIPDKSLDQITVSGAVQRETTAPLELVLGFKPRNVEPLVSAEDSRLIVNAAALTSRSGSVANAIRDVLATAKGVAEESNQRMIANSSAQLLNDDLLGAIKRSDVSFAEIDRVLEVITTFTSQTHEFRVRSWLPDPYAPPDLTQEEAIYRYGNVELRVIENFLINQPTLKEALRALLPALDDETRLYMAGKRANYLAADDVEWNLRALMTNAGFYVSREFARAWFDLQYWAERYLTALQQGALFSYPPAYPFYFKIQRALLQQGGALPRYVRRPNPREVYESFKGKEVMFMSPLSEMVDSQVSSGRLRRLYKNYELPEFSLATLPAWISIWPNRPHNGWTETFQHMCRSVDAAFEKRRFNIFTAACGCYGLPICDYVRSTHGTKVLYLGNIAHAYFGVRQKETQDFMKDEVNPDAWIEGNLGRYANIDRIDGGRYL